MDPIALSIGQMFEIEKFSREIDGSKDVEELQAIAKNLLVAWKQQQAASAWIIRQQQGLWVHWKTASTDEGNGFHPFSLILMN